VMLARLRMTVPQCLEIYRRVGHELFGHRRNVLPLATKYHHKPMEKAVQDIVAQYCKNHEDCDGNDWHPWHPEDDKKPTEPAVKAPIESLANSATSNWSATVVTTPKKPTERICQS
jgi:hypothetical protein